MTRNKRIVQSSLIIIGVSLIILTYFLYPQIKENKSEKNIRVKTEKKMAANVKNEFDNVIYMGENSGNPFTVKAVKAEIREDENIIHMKKMLITVSLSDRKWVVECEAGEYNKLNYNIFCSQDVRASDGKTIVYSQNLDLLNDKSARIYNDVVILDEENSNLYADSVFYDFTSRVYTLKMFSDKESVKVKLIK